MALPKHRSRVKIAANFILVYLAEPMLQMQHQQPFNSWDAIRFEAAAPWECLGHLARVICQCDHCMLWCDRKIRNSQWGIYLYIYVCVYVCKYIYIDGRPNLIPWPNLILGPNLIPHTITCCRLFILVATVALSVAALF